MKPCRYAPLLSDPASLGLLVLDLFTKECGVVVVAIVPGLDGDEDD